MTDSVGKKQHKKHKHKRKSNEDTSEAEDLEIGQRTGFVDDPQGNTPKKTRSKNCDYSQKGDRSTIGIDDECRLLNGRKKKKKKKSHDAEYGTNAENGSDVLVTEIKGKLIQSEQKTRKKKKKQKSEVKACQDNDSSQNSAAEVNKSDLISKKRKKDKDKNERLLHYSGDNHSGTEVQESVPDFEPVIKKKKKHKQKNRETHGEGDGPNLVLESVPDYDIVKKKKKRKHQQKNMESDGNSVKTPPTNTDADTSAEFTITKKCKRTKHKNKLPTDRDEHSQEASRKEKTFISPERNEIEDYMASTTRTKSVTSGQWETATFESDERKQKFMRLLGGFRKSTGSDQTISPKNDVISRGGGFAMGAKAQNSYIQTMENQFTHAVSQNFRRGIGLGYEPPPSAGKKFYIDTSQSKSKKFSDSD